MTIKDLILDSYKSDFEKLKEYEIDYKIRKQTIIFYDKYNDYNKEKIRTNTNISKIIENTINIITKCDICGAFTFFNYYCSDCDRMFCLNCGNDYDECSD